MSINKDLASAINGSVEAVAIKNRLEKLFYEDRKDEDRYGLHASAIIASDEEFCYRAQLLSLFYKQNQGEQLPLKQLKVFSQGNAMHEKWYKLFRKAGIDVAIERTLWLPKYDLSFTIDALLNLFNEEYVCDIKSQNSFSFKKQKGHPHGEKQVNFYLWALSQYTGVEHTKGFVLVDSKDDQEIKVVMVHRDDEKNVEYIERLTELQDMKKVFLKEHQAPPRKCSNSSCKQASKCFMRDACWNIGKGRIKLTKEQRKGPNGKEK